MRRALRNMGGYLVMAVPEEFVVQNGLAEGAEVALHLHGTSYRSQAIQPGKVDGRNARRPA